MALASSLSSEVETFVVYFSILACSNSPWGFFFTTNDCRFFLAPVPPSVGFFATNESSSVVGAAISLYFVMRSCNFPVSPATLVVEGRCCIFFFLSVIVTADEDELENLAMRCCITLDSFGDLDWLDLYVALVPKTAIRSWREVLLLLLLLLFPTEFDCCCCC